jgi:hypothetical protein
VNIRPSDRPASDHAHSQSQQRSAIAHDDVRQKLDALEKLKRRLAEAEAASMYAAAMKAIDSQGSSNSQIDKDAADAAAAAAQAAEAVAAAREAADAAMNLAKQLSANCTASAASGTHDVADSDATASGVKRARCSAEVVDHAGSPRTPAPMAYTTKTPGYISKYVMDSRVPGASDQLARIIKSMLRAFMLERAKQPAHLQIAYGSWNKLSDNDQSLMNSCFDRIYTAEEECIRNFQLEDVCTSKRLQQHVRIALRKSSDGEFAGEADEVERNLYESAQQAAGGSNLYATPSSAQPGLTPGVRSGAAFGHETPLSFVKKHAGSSGKGAEHKSSTKSSRIGGSKLHPNHRLQMQCRFM